MGVTGGRDHIGSPQGKQVTLDCLDYSSQRMTANGYSVAYWGDECFLNLEFSDICKTMNTLE